MSFNIKNKTRADTACVSFGEEP